MAHIPDQLNKINSNIQEAETILNDLKKRTKTENVAEQIEHFESMLNKLNSLKESYLHLSAQFETSSDMKNSLLSVTSVLQNNNQGISNNGIANGSLSVTEHVYNVGNSLEKLKQERDRLKKELHYKQSQNIDSSRTCSLNVDVTNLVGPLNSTNTFTDLVSDLHNFVGLDLSFYISILDHHIDIGCKMIDMVDGLSLSENLQKGVCLLKEVIQRLAELRERFHNVQNTKENIENQDNVEEGVLQQEMESFNSIFEDLKVNFATGVKCFKSAMDIIQSYLDSDSVQVEDVRVVSGEMLSAFTRKLSDPVHNDCQMVSSANNVPSAIGTNNNNNSESASEDNNNRSNEEEDDNNDGGDEESEDSCPEKDQDESEIGVGISAIDSLNSHNDQDVMHNLRLQTEMEQKEILRLLEEKRIMQNKLADLKRAKEVAKSQAISLTQSGNVFGNFSQFLRSSQCNDLGNNSTDVSSCTQRPDTLALRTGDMVNEMGSLLKMLSDMKMEVPCDESYQSSPPRRSNSNTPKLHRDAKKANTRIPFNCNAFSSQSSILLPELNEKAEELKQKQCQIQKLQEMLEQIKNDSLNLNESNINDSNDDYHSDHNNEQDMSNNGRHGKGRDSVTFQEPVATFIANEELYENMREVRMRREELRDRSARNSNSDTRSPSGRVMDSGNAPGAPPDAPTRMPTTSHETASQDRTTAATWGSSSAGGDDYEEHSGGCVGDNLGTRVSPGNGTSDERSRVAPVGQSSTFRSKMRDNSASYMKSVVDKDFTNLKSQIENIASLCRNMAQEQNRLSRDISDLKCGSSPRLSSNGPDIITTANGSGLSKHGLLTDDNLHHWVAASNHSGIGHSLPTTSVADSVANNRAAIPQHIDTSWEEASIASSAALQQPQPLHLLQRPQPPSNWYYPPLANGYQSVLHQQNMLLQNHAMFMKLQMSMIASQLEQQRLCTMAMHQYAPALAPPPALPHTHPGWHLRGISPPYYPPPGPLVLPDPGALPPIATYADIDHGFYPAMYSSSSDGRVDSGPITASNHSHQHTTNNISGGGHNPWKPAAPFPTGPRNIHRN